MDKKLTIKMSIAVLAILYAVGAVGIAFRLVPGLAALTSLHLFISFLFLVYWHEKKGVFFWFWLMIAYLIGTLVEYLGVQYGFLFGSYEYGANMRPVIAGTPIIIGINWILLSYCFTRIVARWAPRKFSMFVIAAISATLMTAFDVLIEPVAIELNFWSWEKGYVPLTNYAGWWIVSLVLNFLFVKMGVENGRNPIAFWVLLFQLFFFVFVYVFRVIA